MKAPGERAREYLSRSHIDEYHIEAVVQVLVEMPRLHQRPHRDRRRAHDTDTAHDLLEPAEDVQLLVGGQARHVVEDERRGLSRRWKFKRLSGPPPHHRASEIQAQ